MKHTSLLAVMLGGALWATSIAADDPKLLDLDGRELIARVYKDRQAGRSELYEKVKVRVRGRTIAPERPGTKTCLDPVAAPAATSWIVWTSAADWP